MSESATSAPKPAEKPAAPKTKTYVVQKTAICPNGGGRDSLVQPGEKVTLTAPQAKHYAALGLLAPVVDDAE